MQKVARTLTKETLPHPGRFRLAAASGKLAQPLRPLFPRELGAMLDMLPPSLPPAQPLPTLVPAEGVRRGRVALLSGCVQSVLSPNINWATARVLAKLGIEVVIPPAQGCCGALMAHNGDANAARALAKRNLTVFPEDVDAVVTNAAGCGSGMREYGLWFEGLPEEAAARQLAARVMDVTVYLAALDLPELPPLPQPLKLAYHDACHLAHAQGVTAPPRQLLKLIPNLTLLDVAESELCCGSAGTYNLEQPDLANRLGQRKAQHLLATGAQAIAAGNIGCLVQIDTHLRRLSHPLPIYHTLEILHQSLEPKSA